jgi:hypothetical protein
MFYHIFVGDELKHDLAPTRVEELQAPEAGLYLQPQHAV